MFESLHEFVEEVLESGSGNNLQVFFSWIQLVAGSKQKWDEIAHMVGMVVREKYTVDIVVGDSEIEELFQVSITKINKSVDLVILN